MALIRFGVCIRCGKCCQPPVVVENPCIERGKDRCEFYVELDNSKLYGHCLIYGRDNKPINVVKGRLGTKITQKQIDWFTDNCIDYPLAKDVEKGHYPPPECSFRFEEVS